MSDTLAEIKARWEKVDPNQCESWWYNAIRHCQRNVDMLCVHEDWDAPEPEDDYTATHPDRYDGEIYAHAAKDITYLLGLVSAKEKECLQCEGMGVLPVLLGDGTVRDRACSACGGEGRVLREEEG